MRIVCGRYNFVHSYIFWQKTIQFSCKQIGIGNFVVPIEMCNHKRCMYSGIGSVGTHNSELVYAEALLLLLPDTVAQLLHWVGPAIHNNFPIIA